MLISQKVTNIHVFRVASLANVYTTAFDFIKEWHFVVYATILGVKMLLLTQLLMKVWLGTEYQVH